MVASYVKIVAALQPIFLTLDPGGVSRNTADCY